MKSLLAFSLAFLLMGCSDAVSPQNNLPPAVALNADAITARQTSDSANARTNALSAQATAARQATREAAELSRQSTLDVSNQRSTDAAIRLAFLLVTATAEAKATDGAIVGKTEDARDAAAVRTSSALNADRTATAIAINTATRRADDDATATRGAARPTETRIAELAADDHKQKAQAAIDEQMRRERERRLESIRFEMEQTIAPWARVWELSWPYCVGMGILAFFLWCIWRVVEAGVNHINSRSLEVNSKVVPQLTIKDAAGNPIGYLTPSQDNRTMTFTPFVYDSYELDEPPPQAPKLLNETRKQPQALAAPPEPLIGEFVYPSTLRAFVQSILVDFDWTQARWRDKTLPRGYVMSMDTQDAKGNTIYGGYSRMIQLFVDRHLIIDRRAGTTGRWNPNAPRDVNAVMDILENKAPIPTIQAVEQAPSPTPLRRRAKRVALS